jgi:putative peptidoglycan lipid II flippase
MKKLTHLTRISLLLAVFFALDKGLGIFRQVFIARRFVLPDQDAFNVANNVPDLISALIAGGALAIAFLPVLSSLLTKEGKAAAWDIFSRVANLAFLVTGGLALVVAALAWPLVSRVIAPGLGLEQQKLVVELMQLDLIATVIFCISGLVMAGLQANQHFLLPAIAPLLYNLGQIFGAVILAPQTGLHLGPITLPAFGMGVHGLVYGVILGAIFHLLIQVPGLVKYQFRWAPRIGLNHPVVKEALSLLGPRVLTMLFIQFIFVARDAIASYSGQGAISSLTYGWMILQVPETLIGTAIATALLPTISEQVARNDWQSFRQTIERAVQVLLAITLPITVILGFGLQPLVALAFGPKFQGDQMVTLMGVTQAFLAGLAGQSCLEIAVRAFYAQKNAKIPLLVSGLNAIVFVGLALLLRQWFGVVGIGLAISLAYTGEAVLLFYLLNRGLPKKLALRGTMIRGLLAAAAGGALVWIIMNGVSLPLPAYGSSVIGLMAGALAALPLVWREVRLLFRL